MRERIVSAENANYIAREWDGVNRSGLRPISDLVVVLPDQASEKIGPKGLLVTTNSHQNTMTLATESGTLIAAGAGAFAWNSDRTRPWMGEKPGPGDRVIFARYGGRGRKGKDGAIYLVMPDNCIYCIDEMFLANEEATATATATVVVGRDSLSGENVNG